MIRAALDLAAEHGRTSRDDTLDIIKLIVEWRGRASIVTDADNFYAQETLELDADNAKGARHSGEPKRETAHSFKGIMES